MIFRPQNLGIVLAFGLAFLIALIFLTEFNTRVSAKMSLVLFKRGAGPKPALTPNGRTDVEMVSVRHGHDDDKTPPSHENLDVIESTGIFTWQHLTYTIQTSSGEKRLLSDVAGHVTPGKLTALMGETGAGKVGIQITFCSVPFTNPRLVDNIVERAGAKGQCWCRHRRPVYQWKDSPERFPIANVRVVL